MWGFWGAPLPARRQVEMSKAIKNVENSIGKI